MFDRAMVHALLSVFVFLSNFVLSSSNNTMMFGCMVEFCIDILGLYLIVTL